MATHVAVRSAERRVNHDVLDGMSQVMRLPKLDVVTSLYIGRGTAALNESARSWPSAGNAAVKQSESFADSFAKVRVWKNAASTSRTITPTKRVELTGYGAPD